MYAVFLIIILIAFTVLVVLRRNVKWGIYVIGTSEVLFRLLHLLGDNLGVAEINSLVNKWFPESLFSIASAYTSGVIHSILFWVIIVLLFWFLFYLLKYVFSGD